MSLDPRSPAAAVFKLTRRGLLSALAPMAACAAAPPPAPAAPPGPPALAQGLDALAAGFDGRLGVAVEDVQAGWVVAHDGQTFYPQQSVSKLWTVLAVLDAADHGDLDLAQPLVVTRADMSVFNQPIQKAMGETGYATTADALIDWAISKSDNAANDILMRLVGGQGVVRRMLAVKGLSGLRASPPEHLLESRIAGLDWRPDYSFGQAFWTARDTVPLARRQALLDAYVADPPDGATPVGLVQALARLRRGQLLSAASTARLLGALAATETGPLRLKAGLPPGWTIAHKTGTGQDLADLSTGYNDVGLITAPDGRVFAVAVMIAATRRPIPERQALMADVARAVVEQATAP